MVPVRSALACVALACVSCGVRAPSRIDVGALVKARGAQDARSELELRVVRDPKDIAARLAIAALDEQLGRPSAAIEQLEAVVALGGPVGTRWHPEDRVRLARLVAARGRVRLARGAASALADLTRAHDLGAQVAPLELARAKLARAIAQLRHIDAAERAAGLRLLQELAATAVADASWRGGILRAGPAERGPFGAWLWQQGARRAAYDELAAWHDAMTVRDPTLQAAYVAARTWWAPDDAAPLAAAELVGAERCRISGADGCAPEAVAAREPSVAAEMDVLLARPTTPTTDPRAAAAWLAITLGSALRGEVAWGRATAARVDVAAIPTAAMPAYARPAFARLAGRGDAAESINVDGLARSERMVVAAGRALRGAGAAQIRAALGNFADSDDGRALLRVAAPDAASPTTTSAADAPPARDAKPVAATPDAAAPDRTTPAGAPADARVRDAAESRSREAATVGYVSARVPDGLPAAMIERIVDGFARDPALADRLAADAVAAAPDAALTHAGIGALFDALADPARARAAWQAAFDRSAEPAFAVGLAGAMARGNDPDAAMIVGTTAAAASGDPAVVWVALARILLDAGKSVHALEAARSAVDLAGPAVLADALDVAIAASRELGRTAQADALAQRRARTAPFVAVSLDGDPTDVEAALSAHRTRSTIETVARLWTASRWNARDVASRAALLAAVATADPRRAVLVDELVALARDRDPQLARAAVDALRR